MDDPHVLAPGMAPTPFTADEIRAGCPDGRTIRMRVDVPGEEAFLRVSSFADGDAEGATLIRSRETLDGVPLGEPDEARVAWLTFQGHASFPAEATTIDEERIETQIGELDCWRYTVRDDEGENVFWFARDLPGMPIRYVTLVDGQVVASVDVVDNIPG